MKNRRGISLIVLVITIIVIIILAGAVILSLANNNPIMSATEATFRNDMQEIQSQLNLYLSTKYAETAGTYDINTMSGEVSAFVPGVTGYDSTFDIVKGKLKYTGTDNQTLAYVRGMNFDIATKYDGTAEILKPTTNVINKTEGTVESWVNVTSAMRDEVAEKYIFSTYADEKYTNTLALRHTRDNTWQAIMSSDYNLVTDISVADTLNDGWHLFSLKWSATEFSLFIDGTKVATTTSPKLMQAVATNMYIGSGPKLNLVKNGYVNMGNTTNFPMFTYMTSDYVSASAAFSYVGYVEPQSSDFITIDANKSYKQTGSFKSAGAGGNSRIWYGVAEYDRDKQFIEHRMVNYYSNTQTQLAKDLKPGDTVVYLNSVANWKTSTDASYMRNLAIYPYKDYPAYTYTRYCYTYTNADLATNTITLSSPYSGALVPAGSKVSDNYDGGTYNYHTLCGDLVPNTWTNYTSTFLSNSFRYGTKYIKLLFLINYMESNPAARTTYMDDLELKDNAGSLYNSKIQELCISNIARSDNDIMKRYSSGILTKDSNVTFMLSE